MILTIPSAMSVKIARKRRMTRSPHHTLAIISGADTLILGTSLSQSGKTKTLKIMKQSQST